MQPEPDAAWNGLHLRLIAERRPLREPVGGSRLFERTGDVETAIPEADDLHSVQGTS